LVLGMLLAMFNAIGIHNRNKAKAGENKWSYFLYFSQQY
jgi:hypothetical protein